MLAGFITIYKRLLQHTKFPHHRYIFDNFNLNNQLTGIIGPRGTGKTTFLLQYIKENMRDTNESIYVSIDNIYFTRNNLVEFVNELYEDYGVRYFFFDEIHRYPNWNQELKNLYDAYPDVKIVFSGSSSIDLIKGTYDLSRRGMIYPIGGMSFREYLLFKGVANLPPISFDDIINNRSAYEEQVAGIKMLKGHFKAYLGKGYYPFVFEDEESYSQKIQRIIEKTIFEDISNHYKLKTENLANFRKILSYMATLPPGELNRNNISKNIGLDNKTVQSYLNILDETGLIQLITKNKSGSNLLRHTEKMYLDNPDLYESITQGIGFESKTGTLREIFFIKMIINSGMKIHFSGVGNFEVNHINFEIGGKSKGKKQIKEKINSSYLVKDDILYGSKYEIPLHLFGFLY